MMRYEKKVTVLSSLLAALLLLWIVGLVFSPERVALRSESARLLDRKTGDVAAISLKGSGGASVELSKSGSSWTLSDGAARLPVQSQRVGAFLDEVASISRLKMVARSKASWTGFQLDEAQAKHILLKDAAGKVLADFYVGGYGPTGSEIYLRRSGQETAYSAETGLASYMDYGRTSWLDLRVLGSLKEADVQSIVVKSSIPLDGAGKPLLNLDYALRRDGKAWKAGAAQIDAEAAASLLRSILALQGEDYVSAPAGAFAHTSASLALELGSGSSTSLEVGASSGENRFYARLGGSLGAGGLVFTLSSYNLKGAFRSLAELELKK